MPEVLDDYYLLFLNKYDDVLVLILKALVLGLGCSFEVEKLLSKPVVAFDYLSPVFKHFMLVICKIFGCCFKIGLPNHTKCLFSHPTDQPKVKIGSKDTIAIEINNENMITILYDKEFFLQRGFDIERSHLNPSSNTKSMFMSRQSVAPKRDDKSIKDLEAKAEEDNVVARLEDNYLSTENIFNPYMAYQNEIDSKRTSLIKGQQPQAASRDSFPLGDLA